MSLSKSQQDHECDHEEQLARSPQHLIGLFLNVFDLFLLVLPWRTDAPMFVVLRFFKVLTSHWRESSRTFSHCSLRSSLLKIIIHVSDKCFTDVLKPLLTNHLPIDVFRRGLIKQASFTTTTETNYINLILAQIHPGWVKVEHRLYMDR